MPVEMGEYVVGAYLEVVMECDVVHYGARLSTGGLGGLNELDVVGLKFGTKTAYLCEVTTHLNGMTITDYPTTVKKFKSKYSAANRYADTCLKDFEQKHFMFWSPRVPRGKLLSQLSQIGGLEFVVNDEYTKRVNELRVIAKKSTRPTNNPFFRTLQILEHLKR